MKLELINSRYRSVEVESVEGSYPAPWSLEMEAINTPEMPRNMGASDYFPAVRVLREAKGFTWLEVQKWLEDRGAPFSLQAIQSAYRKRMMSATDGG